MAEPLPLSYLNGDFLPLQDARISPLDRGFLFGDGVYEVMPVYGGRPFRFGAHAERLTRSLTLLRMQDPHTRDEWRRILATLIERNGGGDQYIYWMVTRGAEHGRNHAPLPEIARTVFAFCAPLPRPDPATLEHGVSCITAQDTRWNYCDINATALLANVMLRQLAIDANAGEAILLRDGELTEASASAVHIVSSGVVLSPPNSRHILPSTTRGAMEELATRAGIPHRSERITEAQLRAADEVWLSAATREVQAVTQLDGRAVGRGRPGPLWQRVREELQRYKRELVGQPW